MLRGVSPLLEARTPSFPVPVPVPYLWMSTARRYSTSASIPSRRG